MEKLSQNRGYVRGKVTRLSNKIDGEYTSYDSIKRTMMLTKCKALLGEIKQHDAAIVAYYIDNNLDIPDTEGDDADEYDDLLGLHIARLESVIAPAVLGQPLIMADGSSASDSSRVQAKLKLPQITLPTFANNSDENFGNFIRSFEAIIQKHNLLDHERYAYLKNQLSGGPLALIKSIDINAHDQYVVARKLLQDAFGNENNAKQDVLKRLSKLKQTPNADPYVFLGELKAITTNFGSLKIEINDVLQYFLWNSLDVNFQAHLTAITNKSFPSLEEIEQNLFEACSRYVKNNKTTVNKTEVNHQVSNTAMAVNVKPKFNKCVLCDSDNNRYDHEMRDCLIYNTASKKLDKLKAIGGCIKCSFRNHKSSECKFNFFSNCRYCQKAHMSYLCLKMHDENNDHRFDGRYNKGSIPTSNHLATAGVLEPVEVCLSTSQDSIILPTFTATIPTAKGPYMVRIFKDSGSQRTFINQNLIEKLDLKIIDRAIPFNIDGINTSKVVHTSVVEVPLLVGTDSFTIEAIVTEKIRTNISVNNIDVVVKNFVSKGYKLADEWLQNSSVNTLTNIDIMLGTNDEYILPFVYELFGNTSQKSNYISTSIGVVLSGNLEQMIKNIEYLPYKTNASQTVISGNIPGISCKDEFSYTGEYKNLPSEDFEGFKDVSSFGPEELELECASTLNLTNHVDDENHNSRDSDVVESVLTNCDRDVDGRLIMNLPWNPRNNHLLAKNYFLSRQILFSTLKKLKDDKIKLDMYDSVFKEQEKLGVIERIPNLENFMELHPECSFLPHMSVYRMGHESTKCRVVFLSNLAEKSKTNSMFSNNECMLSGPCLNHKISTAVMMLRFDKYLITFDIVKAFLSIKLREHDQNRLLFLWFEDVKNGNFDLTAFRSIRLPFGLKCSPCILMLGLFKMLMLDRDEDEKINDLKRSVFNSIYMDNGSYSTNDITELYDSYNKLQDIFAPYQFKLQQFCTNVTQLQNEVDEGNDTTNDEVKLFGLIWHRVLDQIYPSKVHLNQDANTKRLILKSLNEIYDIYNVCLPILLRSKLFLQQLQCNSELGWDNVLPTDLQKTWYNIAKQVNSAQPIKIDRFVGRHDSEYSLIAFTDASQNCYGTVIYIKEASTGKVSFLLAKNRLLSKDLRKKSIPALELQAIEFGVEILLDTYQSLCGKTVTIPIRIKKMLLFTDSTACLHWISDYSLKFEKQQKLSVFVVNRLKSIDEKCQICPITFQHIAGECNPADLTTKPISYALFVRTNYIAGPEFLSKSDDIPYSDLIINLPNLVLRSPPQDCEEQHAGGTVESHTSAKVSASTNTSTAGELSQVVPVDRYSSFKSMVKVYANVLRFVNNLKKKCSKVCNKDYDVKDENFNFFNKATNDIVKMEQKIHFAEVHNYLQSNLRLKKDLPPILTKLNLILDDEGLLRIKSKFPQHYDANPILLPKDSMITSAIIRETHDCLSHSGVYSVLREIRKKYWILNSYSTVLKILKKCIVCKRINEHPIKLNQSNYRDFRINPNKTPFSNIFLDYAGPFMVKLNGIKVKVYLLVLTCLYTRAISLKICRTASVEDFLRAIQLHVYEYGLFQFCVSDLGSQIQAGANSILTFLNDFETRQYFEQNNIQLTTFQHYSKGNSSLGSIVEICVKQTKQLLFKSIRNAVLDYFEFEFIVSKTINMVNKRPIAFKESLRDLPNNDVPSCITPEMLVKGYDTHCLNIIPSLQTCGDEISDPSYDEPDTVKYSNLCKVRTRLLDIYHSEFITKLISQAIDKNCRYSPVRHKLLRPGDIVLLIEKHMKRYHYPMARVVSCEENTLGEVTSVHLVKGSTKEKVYRHVTSLIPLMTFNGDMEQSSNSDDSTITSGTKEDPPASESRPTREAARKGREKIKAQLNS